MSHCNCKAVLLPQFAPCLISQEGLECLFQGVGPPIIHWASCCQALTRQNTTTRTARGVACCCSAGFFITDFSHTSKATLQGPFHEVKEGSSNTQFFQKEIIAHVMTGKKLTFEKTVFTSVLQTKANISSIFSVRFAFFVRSAVLKDLLHWIFLLYRLKYKIIYF